MPSLKLRIPVIQAPMGGGTITTPELVAAVSNAGGLGCLAAAYLSARAIEEQVRRVRELTSEPFAINLFAPEARRPLSGDVQAQLGHLAPIHERFGIAAPALPAQPGEPFEEQFEAVAAARVPVVSFTFGILPEAARQRLRAQDTYIIGTATTVEEAIRLQAAGVDAVVAQGSEAGAHRGTFLSGDEPPLIGTIALVPQIVDAVSIPVIASGGIMDGRGIAAALALGAVAVQMGTAFLVCDECGAPEVYKQAILHATDDATSLTRAFSGRWARGIRNRYMQAPVEPLSYPWQNALTGPMRAAAAKQGARDYLSLWAGQGTRLARRMPAGELVRTLDREMRESIERLR